MDASLLWYPERVHLGPKHKFSTYYVAKVSEVLLNTPKHYFESNGVERILCNFGAPNQVVQSGLKHKFASFYMQEIVEML
jgi:hypothetical protein